VQQQSITAHFDVGMPTARWPLLPMAPVATFFHNSNDLGAGFKRLTEPPEVVYVLELSPTGSSRTDPITAEDQGGSPRRRYPGTAGILHPQTGKRRNSPQMADIFGTLGARTAIQPETTTERALVARSVSSSEPVATIRIGLKALLLPERLRV